MYTDLRKAFDSVPHDLLLKKLKAIGIRDKNLAWLTDYLKGRRQRVVINGTYSEYVDVESGVPQGGVLSGILFSVYISDLPEVIKHCNISLYADDAKLYAPTNNDHDIRLVQRDIDALTQWCEKWRLRLSMEKCFFLQYNGRNVKNPVIPTYQINGHTLERKHEAVDLGITITDDLKFHQHIDKVSKSTRSEIGRIRRSFVTRRPNFLQDLFKTYVRPNIEYCVNVWNPCYKTDIDKLERVQNRFTRLLKFSSVMTPAERNNCIKISTHEKRRERGDLIGIFKFMDSTDLLKKKTTGSSRTNHTRSLELQRYNTNVRKHSFAIRSIHLWNQLPEEVVLSKSLNEFKTKLDKHIRDTT